MSEARKLLEELDATLLCCLNVGEPPSHVHLLREKIVKCRARIDAHLKTEGPLLHPATAVSDKPIPGAPNKPMPFREYEKSFPDLPEKTK